MGPNTIKVWEQFFAEDNREACGYVQRAQHFQISEGIYEVARKLAGKAMHDGEESVKLEDLEVAFEMPSPSVVLELPEGTVLLVGEGNNPDQIWVHVLHLTVEDASGPVAWKSLCIGVPRSGSVTDAYLSEGIPESLWNMMVTFAMQADAILSIVATPRITTLSQPTHKDRERARWKLGQAKVPVVWKTVAWKTDEPVNNPERNGDPTQRNALHFCRAHWARSEEGKPSAVNNRRDPLTKEPIPGWWVRRSHSWRGNPAYGVVLHDYTPRFGREEGSGPRKVQADETATDRAAQHAIASWNAQGTVLDDRPHMRPKD